jgi:hypothetical protein
VVAMMEDKVNDFSDHLCFVCCAIDIVYRDHIGLGVYRDIVQFG